MSIGGCYQEWDFTTNFHPFSLLITTESLRGLFLLVQHLLLRLLSSMRKLIPLVFGFFSFCKLYLPDRGQCGTNFSHLASCDRIWKTQQGKCKTSVSRNLTVHDIKKTSEVKVCHQIKEWWKNWKLKKLHMVNKQYNTIDRVQGKKRKTKFLHHCSSNV